MYMVNKFSLCLSLLKIILVSQQTVCRQLDEVESASKPTPAPNGNECVVHRPTSSAFNTIIYLYTGKSRLHAGRRIARAPHARTVSTDGRTSRKHIFAAADKMSGGGIKLTLTVLICNLLSICTVCTYIRRFLFLAYVSNGQVTFWHRACSLKIFGG